MQHGGRIISAEKAASINAAHESAAKAVRRVIANTLDGVEKGVASRAYSAANFLRNSLLYTMRGDRNGRIYRIPYTKQKYRASAPGEVPAVRTGVFRLSWSPRVEVKKSGNTFTASARIESNVRVGKYLLGDILEKGTGKMAARPYKQQVIDNAMPQIKAVYRRKYRV